MLSPPPLCSYTIYDTNNKTGPTDPQYALRFALCTNIDPNATGLTQCASTTGSTGVVSVQTGGICARLIPCVL